MSIAGLPKASPCATKEPTLKVGGITPKTWHAFPGKPSVVIYVQGCTWQCGYCHSPHLQRELPESPLKWKRVLACVEQQRDAIEAVVFSGGEPTQDAALARAMLDMSERGLRIGMHTGGTHPERLQSVLPLLDWVAFDIKAPFQSYEKITGTSGSGTAARASAKAVIASRVPHEFRTTVHPDLLSESEIDEIATDLAELGATNFVLQAFRPQGCRDMELNRKPMHGHSYPSAGLLKRLDDMFRHFDVHLD